MPDSPRVNRMDRASAVDDIVDELEGIARRPLMRVPPVRGARNVTAILPNGQLVGLRFKTALAPVAAVNTLVRDFNQIGEQREAALEVQRGALRRLSRETTRSLARQRSGALKLQRRLVAADKKLARRISEAGKKGQSQVRQQLELERALVRRLLRRDFWDQIVLASSLPLFAAYGQKGRVTAENNVGLSVSLGTWLVGDELAEFLSGSRHRLPHALRESDIWSVLAPFGNVLSGWWLMRGRQHERFITGLANEFKFNGAQSLAAPVKGAVGSVEVQFKLVGQVDLTPFIASEHLPDFHTFSGIPAEATVASVEWTPLSREANARIRNLTARATEGVLTLSFSVVFSSLRQVPSLTASALAVSSVSSTSTFDVSRLFTSLKIAWVVDTAEPSTPNAQTGAGNG